MRTLIRSNCFSGSGREREREGERNFKTTLNFHSNIDFVAQMFERKVAAKITDVEKKQKQHDFSDE